MIIKHIISATALVSATVILSSCATLGRDTVAVNGANLGPRRAEQTVALRTQPVTGTKVAVISSRRSAKFTSEDIALMLCDLRKEGARAGVDAVTNIRILHDWRRGFINNPRTPFPSVMQGQENLYYLRGDGMRCNGRTPEGVEPTVATFANQQLPKGSISPDKKPNGGLENMMPGSALEAGSTPYLDVLRK